MSDTVKIRMDGKAVEAPAGSTILDVAKREGIYIPTLCHTPLLRPLENCRLCIVRVAGEKQYKAACSTLVAENMDITTRGGDLQQTRKLLLELLLDTHYGDCVAPCSVTCPANVDIQGYLALIRHGEYREAVRLIKEKIPMPATIGRVCPHPCEGDCRRHLVDEPININHCKRFVADYELNSGERILPQAAPSSGHRVAIVGSGPAGLSAAYYLRTLGHDTTIFEAKDKLGGMLRYGIPEYRLPKQVLDWEIDGILSLGVQVKTGVCWGKDFTLDDLKRDGYDAVFLAIGAWANRNLGIIGEDLQGVVSGVDFLDRIAHDPQSVTAGKNVVVIGGGNVAIDAARSALRLGSEKVTILYRRSRTEMPASHEEIEAVQEEGVDIQFLVAPTQIYGNNGAVNKLQFIRMELGEPDASGRRRPVPLQGSEMTIETDQVISAIGQFPQVPLPEMDSAMNNLPLTRWNTIGGDPRSMHTNHGMIFVGGDVFRGPSTVVAALADGRKAAYSLDRYFRVGEVQPEPLHFNISKGDLKTIDREPFSVLKTISRESMPHMETQKRIKNFQEVELGLSEEQARKEAGRCLVCGCSAAFDCRLRELMNEFQVDWRDQPSKKIHYQRVAAVDVHPVIALDPNKCIRCERCHVGCATFQCSDAIILRDWPRFNDRCVSCGFCVDLCPTGALMEKREERAVERLDWDTVTTHCIHCGCGCELELKMSGERLAWISDGRHNPPSWASTCQRGRFHIYDPLWYGERVLKPLMREGKKLREVSWRMAIGKLLDGFRAVQKKHGSQALGAMASPRSTNEALYLLQKWMRAGWNSNSLDFPGREPREELWALLRKSGEAKRMNHDLAALERAEAIFVWGDGVDELAPVVATIVRRTVRNRKVPLWQIAGDADDLSAIASIAIHAAPEHWGAMLQDLLVTVARSGQVPESSLGKAGIDPGLLKGKTSGFAPGKAGIAAEKWQELVKAFAAASSVAFIFPESLLASPESADAAATFIQLALLTGQREKANGVGIYPLTAEINSSGALLMGVSPNYLPGFIKVTSKPSLKKLEKIWQVSGLSNETSPGLEKALEAKKIKALFVQQAALLWESNPERWKKLLSGVEFLVLQESAPSPALDLARVVLPVAAYGEQTGTVINLEGRLLSLERAFAPQGKCLADWEILMQVMAAQEIPLPADLEAIREEMKAVVPELARFDWRKKLSEKVQIL